MERVSTIRGPGLRAAYQAEDAFRQEVLLAALLIPLACCWHPTVSGWR
jgi:diacylglycerol kinase